MQGHLLLEDVVYSRPGNLVFTVTRITQLTGEEVNEAVRSQTVYLQLEIYTKSVPKMLTNFTADEATKLRTGTILQLFGEFLDNKSGVPLTNRIRAQLLALQPICAGD